MIIEIKKFVIGNLIIATFIALIGLVFFTTFLEEYYHPVFPYLLVFVVSISILVHYILVHSAKKNQLKFYTSYMLTFGIKFFGYLALIIIYFFAIKENLIAFSVAVILLYIIFTFYEVRSLLAFLKRIKNTKQKS